MMEIESFGLHMVLVDGGHVWQEQSRWQGQLPSPRLNITIPPSTINRIRPPHLPHPGRSWITVYVIYHRSISESDWNRRNWSIVPRCLSPHLGKPIPEVVQFSRPDETKCDDEDSKWESSGPENPLIDCHVADIVRVHAEDTSHGAEREEDDGYDCKGEDSCFLALGNQGFSNCSMHF